MFTFRFFLKINFFAGHADLSKLFVFTSSCYCFSFTPPYSEWLTHQHRDTLSSIVGHPSLLSYLAIADGEATGRIKFEMTEVPRFDFYTETYADGRKTKRMLQPCGPPPPKDDD